MAKAHQDKTEQSDIFSKILGTNSISLMVVMSVFKARRGDYHTVANNYGKGFFIAIHHVKPTTCFYYETPHSG